MQLLLGATNAGTVTLSALPDALNRPAMKLPPSANEPEWIVIGQPTTAPGHAGVKQAVAEAVENGATQRVLLSTVVWTSSRNAGFVSARDQQASRPLWLIRSIGKVSTAPMSQCAPCGRAMPRWSSAGHPASLPASMAGLPVPGSSVCMLLKLDASSGPRRGSTSRLPPPSVPNAGFQAALPPEPFTMLWSIVVMAPNVLSISGPNPSGA